MVILVGVLIALIVGCLCVAVVAIGRLMDRVDALVDTHMADVRANSTATLKIAESVASTGPDTATRLLDALSTNVARVTHSLGDAMKVVLPPAEPLNFDATGGNYAMPVPFYAVPDDADGDPTDKYLARASRLRGAVEPDPAGDASGSSFGIPGLRDLA